MILSKPVKSLNVWEKSLLASHGRLRGDDTEPAITSLFPAIAAPGSLINRILSIELASLSVNDRDVSSLPPLVVLFADGMYIRPLFDQLRLFSYFRRNSSKSVKASSWTSRASSTSPHGSPLLSRKCR